MAEVIYMADVQPIKPKNITGIHHGQRYSVTFDPNAMKHEQWVWVVDFVRKYKFFGACPTQDAAQSRAYARIMKMEKYVIETEERE